MMNTKNLLCALGLFIISTSSFAEMDTTELDEIGKKMTMQSSNILKEFESHKMATKEGIYQSIWQEEFHVVDYISIAVNTIEILKLVDKNNLSYKVAALRAAHNLNYMLDEAANAENPSQPTQIRM